MATLPRSEFGRLDHLSRSATTFFSVLQKLFLLIVCIEEEISIPRYVKFLVTGIDAGMGTLHIAWFKGTVAKLISASLFWNQKACHKDQKLTEHVGYIALGC